MKVGRAEVGPGQPLLLIAGPCVIEGEAQTLAAARKVADVAQRHGLPAVFKCSFDKANRTSGKSFRGPGLRQGLRVLARVKQETGLPVLTDVHEVVQCAPVAEVADVLQIPAFLCRQTDLLLAAGATGRAVNVKKGQFLAPTDMKNAVAKLLEAGCHDVLLTERGATFGYHDLVVDFRGLIAMRKFAPVCFDATHSVQQPGGQGDRTGGDRTLAPPLARAAAAVGIDALFCEVHEDPDRALSDGPNSLTFPLWEETVADVQRIRTALMGR
ncbi:MAG TPA: 3-deoxy-8-phosphooctulonate synthase [Myxococcales bacterium]|jgi:2-dehydro-3-deoxyphosphooctonate aldolase (KDO 8-P synthase)|nr:3-deoxy-8-phosphooctulonate synthase [Myxococcales bacterium]